MDELTPCCLETIWVLESAYDVPRPALLDSLESLTEMPVLTFEKVDLLHAPIAEGRRGQADLSDLLIALKAESHACGECLTFDRKAARQGFFKPLA